MLQIMSVSLAGPHHVDKGIPCQDACFARSEGDMAATAVADGLGSEAYSQMGARVAAEAAVDYCLQAAPDGAAEDAEALLHDAFAAAWDAVQAAASAASLPLGQMDCTLCLALYDMRARHVVFGNAGDSGLAAVLEDGTYVLLTVQDRDDQGRVYPLCFTERWSFGQAEDVAGLLLCTDGVLEGIIAPPLLAQAGEEQPIDTRLARPFLHPKLGEGGIEELQADCAAYLRDFPADLLDDDKTVLCVFDPDDPPAEQPADYYAGPDWNALSAQAEERLRAALAASQAQQDADETLAAPVLATASATAVARVIDPQPADTAADQLREAARDTALLLGAGVITAAAAAASAGIAVGQKVNARRSADAGRRPS